MNIVYFVLPIPYYLMSDYFIILMLLKRDVRQILLQKEMSHFFFCSFNILEMNTFFHFFMYHTVSMII